MVQANVQHNFVVHFVFLQQLPARFRVGADDGKFFVGELAGLV